MTEAHRNGASLSEGTGVKSELANMVVVVDDEQNIRETLAYILEAEGIEVETSADGVEGLEAVKRCKPKVVLLDVMMPRMDGYEVCRQIRSASDLAEVFVIIVTARGQRSDEVMALNVGANLYVAKPFDDAIVLEVIGQVFEGKLTARHGRQLRTDYA